MRRSILVGMVVFWGIHAYADDISQANRTVTNESEVGVVTTGGNSRSQTFNFKQMNAFNWGLNAVKLNARYLRAESFDIESAKFWLLSLRYERVLSPILNAFAQQSVEQNIFAAYLQRYDSDIGAKYKLREGDAFEWFFEGGYRNRIENRITPPNTNNQYARLYSEVNYRWNPSVTSRFWLEYLPNFTVSTDYQINTEASISAVLNSIFSAKISYLFKFDNLPAIGASFKTDTQLTSALVAKF